jgi:peptidyl-tRNA hydrolase, PTH1 family
VKLIVGLGNPGTEYEETRHNIGFMVVGRLVERTEAVRRKSRHAYRLFEGTVEGETLLFQFPLLYMNRSGHAVSEAAETFRIAPGDIIIIYDDFNLPLGRIRIRPSGSAGGHNGLDSVLTSFGTHELPRVRLGIFNERSYQAYATPADFVLSSFEPDEETVVKEMIQRALDATLMIVREGIPKAMNTFNRVTEQP